jgi:hypothetical protein
MAARTRSGPGAASRVALVVTSLLTAACATSTPHPPTGMMWGYIGKSTNPPTLEIVGYAPDRPSCEYSRAMGQTRSGVPVPSQRSDQCQPLQVLPYREGADSVYWVFGPDIDVDHFGVGANDRSVCLTLREQALKAFRRLDTLSECEPLIVKRAM